MAEEGQLRRPPNSAYLRTNGFIDPVKLQLHAQPPTARESCPGASESDLAFIEKRMIRDSVEKHRIAEDMLDIEGEYFPSLEEMESFNAREENIFDVKRRSSDLVNRHRENLNKLFDWQAQDYLSDAMDLFLCKDDGVANADVEKFFQSRRKHAWPLPIAQTSVVNDHRYAYLKSHTSLLERQGELRKEEEAERRRRDSAFPASIQGYYRIRNKDIQLRVARFLTSDNNGKERMLSEFGWAWRQVRNLEEEFKSNAEFKNEIQESVRELETVDPRRKPSFASTT